MIDGIVMKGIRIKILFSITEADTAAAAQQLHGKRKTRLLVRESVYCLNMNADIDNTMKQCYRWPTLSANAAA